MRYLRVNFNQGEFQGAEFSRLGQDFRRDDDLAQVVKRAAIRRSRRHSSSSPVSLPMLQAIWLTRR